MLVRIRELEVRRDHAPIVEPSVYRFHSQGRIRRTAFLPLRQYVI
jgi:hypothetical protein